jgi:uncharacterized protein
MARTALELNPKEWQSYRPLRAIKDRRLSSEDQIEERRQEARRVAEEAAKVLRREFGASRVVLFGSATSRTWFTSWSDIDLAVWGIAPDRFYAAVAAVTGFNADFKIDLIDAESCSPVFRLVIERDGVEL